jgi:carbamoyltransferase
MCTWDGKKFKYLQLERHFNIKHYSNPNLFEWKKILKNVFHYDVSDIESIGISLNTNYNGNFHQNQNDVVEKINLFDLGVPTYNIDHHYAHGLSSLSKSSKHFVSDCQGNHRRWISVLDDKKIINTKHDPIDGKSFGLALDEMGFFMGVGPAYHFDNAGKIMAFNGYGEINKTYLNFMEKYGLEHSAITLEYNNLENVLNKFITPKDTWDFVKTFHHRYSVLFQEYLKKYFEYDEMFTYSGGVMQNIVINTKLKEKFKNLEINPVGYDGGLSIGALEAIRRIHNYPEIQIPGYPYIQEDECPEKPSQDTINKTGEYLAQGKIVMWYQGKGEAGPRALGNRSILANPNIRYAKEMVNEKVKKREWYRPYGASVKQDKYRDYFKLDWESPYMLYQAECLDPANLQSITHADGSCRIQTVSPFSNDVFYNLLDSFEKLSGFPILLNTSMNLPGYPMVGSIENTKKMFDNSDCDVLIIGNNIHTK